MKELTTQVTITSFTDSKNASPIIESAIAFIKSNNDGSLSLDKISDMKTALSEAVNNSITFAYPYKQGKVSVSVSIYANKILKLKVRDWGCGIGNITKAREPMFTTGTEENSGMGFTIMDSFSDKLTVKSTVGKGTIVTMEFKM